MPNVKKTSNHTPTTGVPKTVERTSEPCPICSTALAAGAKFCSQCGRELVQDKETDSEQVTAPVKKTSSDDASIQKDEQDVSLKPVQSPESTQKSSMCTCGQSLPAEAQFCYRCGNSIDLKVSQYMILCRGKDNKDTVMHITEQELRIGKSADCDLAIPDDDYISRQHACLVKSNGSILLKDLNSSNGTFLRVQKTIILEPGDEFLVGTRLIRLEKAQA